jgi:Co/Zn/Cd efflux system component
MAHCHHDHHQNDHAIAGDSPCMRRVLWIALAINAGMFATEIVAGTAAESVALYADAVDFLGDAANYGIALAVLGLAVGWRARAALLKGVSMGLFGAFVLGRALWAWYSGTHPEPLTMGVVGALALAANLGVAMLLYHYRDGDANIRSVWLCTRNDALGNVAVMLAALGVFGTGQNAPDLAVAAIIATLALSAAWSVIGQARRELQQA